MIAAGNDLVISYTIRSANGTQKPPMREQNYKKRELIQTSHMIKYEKQKINMINRYEKQNINAGNNP